MGYVQHHAIVVTCWNSDHLKEAHALAVRNNLAPTEITAPSAVNGYQSFLIPPDGSKEGWTDSVVGDERRAAWRKAMKELGTDNYCEWCEVTYGDDYQTATVEHHSFG